MTTEYRSELIESVNQLIQMRHRLFGDALNLALLGDLREINDAFDEGDSYKFELSHLKDSSDSNVNRLVSLIENIESTVDLLIEENEIEEDEIQWGDNQPEDTSSEEDPGEDSDQAEDQDEPIEKAKDLSKNMSTEELCKAFGIPYKNETKKYEGQTTLMFSGARTKEQLGISVEAEVNRFFDDTSRNSGHRPKLTILTGSVRSGKTTLRKQEYSQGYVLLDAAEIFSTLSHGKHLVFPSTSEKALNKIGLGVALRAIKERRNIVTEIIGEDPKELKLLVARAESIGYKIILVLLLEDADKPGKRKAKGKISNISAYDCQPYHIKWILSAIRKTKAYEKSKQ